MDERLSIDICARLLTSHSFLPAHSAPKFYLELKDNTLPRYNTVVALSFGISVVLMGYITAIGFSTFGKTCSGLILNNYASSDFWIAASRVAVAVSLVFSYPLAFQGCRDGILDLLQVSSEKRTHSFLNGTTMTLLGVLTLLAAILKDVSFVLAFGGATLGNLLTYVYRKYPIFVTMRLADDARNSSSHSAHLLLTVPTAAAIMYKKTLEKQGRKETLGLSVAAASAVLGTIMGAIGAKMALDKL